VLSFAMLMTMLSFAMLYAGCCCCCYVGVVVVTYSIALRVVCVGYVIV